MLLVFFDQDGCVAPISHTLVNTPVIATREVLVIGTYLVVPVYLHQNPNVRQGLIALNYCRSYFEGSMHPKSPLAAFEAEVAGM